ncbi:MAG: type I restriction endonuclease subunit R, partial [Synergistes sp.]|nr:type I restriction endonuclease subunit R [Synergistes sp.]
ILVQESAGNLLRDELGWDVRLAYNTEALGERGTFGRRSYKDILLARFLREALKKLNPWISETQIQDVQKSLEERLSTASPLQINEEKYFLLRDGIPVTVRLPGGRTETRKAIVIDFLHPENNYFLAVKELKIHGDLYRRRTDIVGFVNGLPLLFVELKKNTVDVRNAYEDNYTDYQDTIPQLFYYNAFLMLSNGTEAKIGTLGSKYEFFHEWKRLAEKDQGSVALETMLRGVCKKENFLDLFENFILYDHSGGKTTKILARNHQYLGVNEAVKAYEARKLNNGKLGVFWHTQGAGKSYSMAFLSQKIRRKFAGSPTIVVLTDRDELNRQISDMFENCALLGTTKASQFIASSGEDLVRKLSGNPGFIFTLIQKFNRPEAAPIYPDHDIIIMSDEAHRSQYGVFADNMMKLLPTAARIGFTGTPLLSSDNITKRTFGGYISVYDFRRAVEDGATVPLYYENRGEKILDLHNPEISDRILDAIEDADIDEKQQEKLEAEFGKEIHLLTAEPRLRSIAKDFVAHYSDLWTSGKAMFVCLNKVTCVRMYDFVQEYWQEEIKALEAKIKTATQQEAQELERKLAWMRETEMAVVVSQEQNEIQTFKKWGLNIGYHREKMEKRELDKEFKDAANPFRIVFVCAMWLTGFDVKCLSCLYLDKPLKAHTLMQAIARANRVDEGKSNGLIIDYIGIVKALRKALADYTANAGGQGGEDPTVDKEELIARILDVIEKTKSFLRERT